MRARCSSAPAADRRRRSAWKNCHSSKAALSRRPNSARKSPRYSSATRASRGRHSGQTSASACPCVRRSTRRSSNSRASTHSPAPGFRRTVSPSASTRSPSFDLLSAHRVRRRLARARGWSKSGQSNPARASRACAWPVTARYASRAIALRVSRSTAAPSRSRRGVPNRKSLRPAMRPRNCTFSAMTPPAKPGVSSRKK